MRKFQLLMAIITAILMASTVICGMWIRSVGSNVPDYQSSLNFHMMIGIATLIAFFITFITIVLKK